MRGKLEGEGRVNVANLMPLRLIICLYAKEGGREEEGQDGLRGFFRVVHFIQFFCSSYFQCSGSCILGGKGNILPDA